MAGEETLGKLKIAINLDNMQLEQDLAEVRRSLKTAQAQFRANSAGVDKYNKSIDDLRQESKDLNNVFEQQVKEAVRLEEELKRLKADTNSSAEAIAKAEQNYLKSVTAMKKTESQLIRVREEIAKQEKASAESARAINKIKDATDKATESLEGVQKKFAGVTKAVGVAGAAIGAAFAGIGVASLAIAKDFDQATTQIMVQLGLTSAEAEKFSQKGKGIWTDGWGESITEVSKHVALAKQYLGDLNDVEMDKIIKGGYTLQESFGADMNEVLRAAQVMMLNLGIDGENAMDIITAGFQDGLDFSGEWLDTLREYAPHFAELGISGEQAFAMMSAAVSAGAWQLDKVADLLKEGHIRMQDLSKASLDAYKALGMNGEQMSKRIAKGGEDGAKAFQEVVQALEKVTDETKRNEYATALMGTQYEDLREDVMFAMGDAIDITKDLSGTTARAVKAMEDSFDKKLKKIMNTAKASLLPIGTVLLDIAEEYLPEVQTALNKFSESIKNVDWRKVVTDGKNFVNGVLVPLGNVLMGVISFVASLDQDLLKVVVTFVALTAAISPVAGILAKVTTGFSGLLGLVAKMNVSMGAAGLLGILTSPLGLVAGFALLATGVALYAKESQKLNDVNLDQYNQMKKTYDSTEQSIAQLEALRNKTKLTTDEFARYMDIQTQLQDESDPKALEALQQEMEKLQEKSGLTNVELNEMVGLNKDVTEALPEATKKVTDQGNKIAKTTDELKQYNAELLRASTLELEKEFAKSWENQAKLVKQQNSLMNDRLMVSMQQSAYERVMKLETEEQRNAHRQLLDQKIQELQTTLGTANLTKEQRDQIGQQIELYGVERGLLNQKEDSLKEQLIALKQNGWEIDDQLEDNRTQQQQFKKITDQLQLQYLTAGGISRETAQQAINGGKQLTVIDTQLKKLREQKYTLEQSTKPNEKNSQAYLDQIKSLDKQIGNLETAQGEMLDLVDYAGDYNTELKQDIQKQINAKTSVDKTYTDIPKATTKGVNAKTSLDARYGELSKSTSKVINGVTKPDGTYWGLDDTWKKGINTSTSTDNTYKNLKNGVSKHVGANTSTDSTYKNLAASLTKRITISAFVSSSFTNAIKAFEKMSGINIPFFAEGTSYKQTSGLAVVGEAGTELVKIGNQLSLASAGMYDLPRGTQIFSNSETMNMLQSAMQKMGGSGQGGAQIVQHANTTHFSPNVTIVSDDGMKAAQETERMLRRMAFKGGISR